MFLKHTITVTASHTHTIPYKQLYMQACTAADIAQQSAAIKLDTCKTTVYTRSTRNNRMGLCQKRNLTVRTHPKLSTQNVVGITNDWQHGFICTCSFHNWFADVQMVLLMENNATGQ